MLYYIYLEVVDDLGVYGTYCRTVYVRGGKLCTDGVLSVLTEVGDYITHAHNAALKG